MFRSYDHLQGEIYTWEVGCLHPVACTRSGSGFPSNATGCKDKTETCSGYWIKYSNQCCVRWKPWTWQFRVPYTVWMFTTSVLPVTRTTQSRPWRTQFEERHMQREQNPNVPSGTDTKLSHWCATHFTERLPEGTFTMPMLPQFTGQCSSGTTHRRRLHRSNFIPVSSK
jgi:hypothetical protein